ncbi:hypothetical protein [Limosilactobacillus reuteri]|uniref:hypothetical protein n=1 Tax=Limosilactobacillus reuteri TaxID=1598 RepID=UPI0021A34A89|nr:hypothetical protein [Limosilactobacillus reuteri]MCT3199036.1 hypothetical protein [Limosilactobacillus reuteri]
MIKFQEMKSDYNVPLPSNQKDITKQLATVTLQQAQFQIAQQKLNSQLALQVAQLTTKERKQNV